ncbi:ATP-binding cassette domain-containing protein [Planococcus sp. APC 4015]|nr:ATP-binding cassette domain-containing protein [Planococcus sp. APC 4015]
MTASLPVPHEPTPDDPEETGARAGDGRIVEFTKNVRPTDAAGGESRPKPKRPTAPRPPRKRTPKVAPVDPGPPPPLPPEFTGDVDNAPGAVLPPKPELPADVVAAAIAAPAPGSRVPDAVKPPLPPKPALPVTVTPVQTPVDDDPARPEPVAEVAAPDADPVPQVVEPEQVAEAVEPEPVADAVEPEPVTESAEPEPVADAVEPEPVAEPVEPEAVADAVEPEVLPEAVQPEPEPEFKPEPELVAETAEPDPIVETETEAVTEDAVVDPEVEDLDLLLDEATKIEVAGTDAPDSDFDALAAVFAEAQIEASVDEDSAALLVRGVSKSFGETRAVEGIDLTVPAGSFYGLVGPNGAGKTTTLSMIAGLLAPDRGVIRVGGVDAASQPLAAKRLLGVLPDRLRTFDRLTGRQLLYYYGVLRGLSSSVVASRTADLARAFDLTDALGRVVSDYSAGMLKKVMLAGAMIHSPRVLVLDEPFEAVDPVSSAVILDILSAYVAHGGTVILSSHGMDLVERVCTRVAVIVAGQVLAEGTVEEVRGELTLEQRFIELAGGLSDVEGLEWLHTFSD